MGELNHLRVPYQVLFICDAVLSILETDKLTELSNQNIGGAINFLEYALIGARYVGTWKNEEGVGFSKWLDGLTTYLQVLNINPSLKKIAPKELKKKIQSYEIGLRQLRDGTQIGDDLRAELKEFFSSLREYYYEKAEYPIQDAELKVA